MKPFLIPFLHATGRCIGGLALALSLVSVHAQSTPEAQQFTLSNGLTLIVKVDKRAPTAVHMLWVRVGSMDEVDGVSGVAHVLVRRRRDSN